MKGDDIFLNITTQKGMALTEAQKRAKRNYEKKVKKISLQFYPTETDLYEYLQTKENKAGFIKQLIREAMESERQNVE